MIRELEKFRPLRDTLLNHERSTSYLMMMAIVTACALLVILVRASAGMNRHLRGVWLAALSASILLVYYADSRVEVQLYEHTMHRSLYLAGAFLAMALAGTLCGPSSPISMWWKRRGAHLRRAVSVGAVISLIGSVVFTFLHFGTNQNLKTQIFYRSTQAKQNFKLAWWVLDPDRDGYSACLDGGDASESNEEIHPGIPERVSDQIDNNGLAGNLAQQDLDDWRNLHNDLRPAPLPGARRFNVIFFLH